MATIIFISDILLISIAIAWLFAACITDIKKREVPNWLSFSLITIAFAIRVLASVLEKQFFYLFYALIAFGIFFFLVNLFYRIKFFGGGDAKLLLALAVVLATTPFFVKSFVFPFSFGINELKEPFLLTFFVNALTLGSVYGLAAALFFTLKNKKKFINEFKKESKKRHFKTFKVCSWIFTLFCLILSFFFWNFLIFFFIFLILPYLFVFIRAAENIGMIKKIKVTKLSEGDWLVKAVRIKNKIIKAGYEGLSNQDITAIKRAKKHKYVLIKQGLPFVPVFLVALLASLFFGNLLILLVQAFI